jgi:transposase
MNSRVKIACGLDVHRSKIVGSIVTFAGTNDMRTFTTNIDGTLALKDWIITHECERVAMEATGYTGTRSTIYLKNMLPFR